VNTAPREVLFLGREIGVGNVGSIEKVMVFGILAIIVAILGIAMWGSNEIDEPAMATVGHDESLEILSNSVPASAGAIRPEDLSSHGGRAGSSKFVDDVDEPVAQPVNVQKARKVSDSGLRLAPVESFENDETDIVEASLVIAPEFDPSPGAVPETHTVVAGDTMEGIARRYYGDPRMMFEIMKENEDVDPQRMAVGTVLRMPRPADDRRVAAVEVPAGRVVHAPKEGARQHTVQKGDTLYGLAIEYYGESGRWRDILEANLSKIPDVNSMSAGTVLDIP